MKRRVLFFERSLANLLRVTIVALVSTLTIAVPVVHYDLDRQFLSGNLAILSELTARQLMDNVIARNPTLWAYEESRMQALMRQQMLDTPVRQAVYRDDGRLVLALGAAPMSPCLTRRTDLLDAGVSVGYLETSASLRPFLWESLELGLLLVGAGVLMVVFFSLYPLRRLHQAERRIQYLADHDPLTGQLNRYVAEPLFEQEMRRAERYGLQLTLIMFDIDHFKRINDAHGHSVGDRVLRRLTERVADNLRASDYLVRWGGEEFLIISTHTDLVGARELVEKLRHLVEHEDFALEHPVTISLGICACRSGMSLVDCLNGADDAMYRAKRMGRNRWAEASECATPADLREPL